MQPALIYIALSWWMTSVGGQRAPCYHCELYKDTHPHSHPYSAVRARCVYPCDCNTVPKCREANVPLIKDGCGCCWQCAKQAGETCDGVQVCDVSKGLQCHYETSADAKGVCKEKWDSRCRVNGQMYDDGQTFTLDCRTQCSCQNGTYACVSLCPGETIPPSSRCHNPHLVNVPGQCCREWMCDSDVAFECPSSTGKAAVKEHVCDEYGPWSRCSLQTCGTGVSVRWSNGTEHCPVAKQTRLCQIRPCRRQNNEFKGNQHRKGKEDTYKKHHIRRGHTCKATQRPPKPVRLQAGWCISERRYRPRYCGLCTDRCCGVLSSTTILVAFLCPLHANDDSLYSKSHRKIDPVIGTRLPNVYDMMDEGQPTKTEPLVNHPQHNVKKKQHQTASRFSREPDFTDLADGDLQLLAISDGKENLVYLVENDNENMIVEDEKAYNNVKKDNYKLVHHRVQWIRRCKCNVNCETDQSTTYV